MKRHVPGWFHRWLSRSRKPPLPENDQYLAVLKEVDPLWRFTGPPRKTAFWKLLVVFAILAAFWVLLWTVHF